MSPSVCASSTLQLLSLILGLSNDDISMKDQTGAIMMQRVVINGQQTS
jgi:hypothetical protein